MITFEVQLEHDEESNSLKIELLLIHISDKVTEDISNVPFRF